MGVETLSCIHTRWSPSEETDDKVCWKVLEDEFVSVGELYAVKGLSSETAACMGRDLVQLNILSWLHHRSDVSQFYFVI